MPVRRFEFVEDLLEALINDPKFGHDASSDVHTCTCLYGDIEPCMIHATLK